MCGEAWSQHLPHRHLYCSSPIKSAYRNSPPPSPMIVKFTNRKAEDAVFQAKLQLKQVPGAKIYFNEDLTKTASSLFRTARRLLKEKKIVGPGPQEIPRSSVCQASPPACKPMKLLSEGDFPVF